MAVLRREDYQFINISIGPDLPVDDNDVDVWTSTIDDYLASGTTLATIAVGNEGTADRKAGLNRIQPPSDCVNGIGVGSCHSSTGTPLRAAYSCMGPGRSPGLIKPDGLSFGGTTSAPFYVADSHKKNRLIAKQGTSFASPTVLRAAVGVRALLGERLRPLTLRCLLIHHTEREVDQHPHDVGWGRFNVDPNYLIGCEDSEATVVFQDSLVQGKYLQAKVPLPSKKLRGDVFIKATFCFAAEIDPEHPLHYTRNGLEVFFRPDMAQIVGKHNLAKSTSFFSAKNLYPTEQDLRQDAHKWETCLHFEQKYDAATLNAPSFDIHYQAREQGHNAKIGEKLPYALIISVRAPLVTDLYAQVSQAFPLLQPITPQIRLPIEL